MTFRAVEDLVGRLPESAYRHRAWWGNNDGTVEAKAWLDAGWRVESVNRQPARSCSPVPLTASPQRCPSGHQPPGLR